MNIFIISGVVLVFLAVTAMLGVTWSEKVLFKSCQPSGVHYDSKEPYCLAIVKQTKTFSHRLKIKIASQSSLTEGSSNIFSGTFTEINYLDDNYKDYIYKSSYVKPEIKWSADGVAIESPMMIWTDEEKYNFDKKYTLFIPKESFIGGR